MGEYRHSIDSKNRTSLPSRFKGEMGNRVVLLRGLDNNIDVYTWEAWNELNEKLKKLSITKDSDRKFARFILSGATEVELDKQGRVRIPDFLKEYAGIDKKVVWVGVGEKAEIWNEERWEEYLKKMTNESSKVAESLEGLI